MKKLIPVLLALLMMPVQAGDVETAATYNYVVAVDDPAGDHTGPNALSGGPVPGTFNNENDLLKVEVTDDANTFIIRTTTVQCDFDVPTGFALIIFEVTGPGGEDWDVSVAYDDGCTNPRGIEVDSVLGDADVPMPGMRFGADAANNQIYIFSDYADNGMSEGDSVTFDRVHTGRQFAGRYTFGMDEVTLPAFQVGSGAALNTAEAAPEPVETGPIVESLDLAGEQLSHSHPSPVNITYHYNWTAPGDNGTFVLAIDGNGSADVTVHDANGALRLQSASQSKSQGFENAPGPWNLTIVYASFEGTLNLTWVAPDSPEAVEPTPPEEPETPANNEPEAGEEPEPEDNSTAPPVEESPAAPVLLVAGAIMLLAWIRRR